DLHSLFFKVGKCLWRLFPDRVRKHDIGKRRHLSLQLSAVRSFVTAPEYKHTVSLCGLFPDLFLILRIILPEDKLRSPKHIGSVLKRCTAVFKFRRKGCDLLCPSSGTFLKIGLHCFHRNIVLAHGLCKITDDPFERRHCLLVIMSRGPKPLNFHCILRNGTCLVHTEHIDSGQSLDTLHVMQKYFLLGKTHCAYRKSHTCKQIKTFRDHSDDSRYHGSDT